MQRFLKIKTILFCAFSGETTPIFNNGGDFFFYNVRIFKADVDFVLIGLIEEHCFSNHRSHCYNPLISTSNTDMRLSTMRRCFVFCVVIWLFSYFAVSSFCYHGFYYFYSRGLSVMLTLFEDLLVISVSICYFYKVIGWYISCLSPNMFLFLLLFFKC